jgi:hypothetical protein
MPHYDLKSGVARHTRHPNTFWIPDREDRESLNPGDMVKLLFVVPEETRGPSTERMWVKVTRVSPDGTYRGELNNAPVFIRKLPKGTTIKFGPEHVIDITRGSTKTMVYAAGALVAVAGVSYVGYRMYKKKKAADAAAAAALPAGSQPQGQLPGQQPASPAAAVYRPSANVTIL